MLGYVATLMHALCFTNCSRSVCSTRSYIRVNILRVYAYMLTHSFLLKDLVAMITLAVWTTNWRRLCNFWMSMTACRCMLQIAILTVVFIKAYVVVLV